MKHTLVTISRSLAAQLLLITEEWKVPEVSESQSDKGKELKILVFPIDKVWKDYFKENLGRDIVIEHIINLR